MVDDTVTEALAALRALARDASTSYATLVTKAHALITLAPVSIGTICPSGQELFRGTSYHTSVPLHQAEISYPPADRVHSFGRANCPGKPIFYCSPDPTGVFKELRSRVGQYAVLAKWVTTRPAVLHGLGYSSTVFDRANAQRHLPDPYREFDSTLDPRARAVRDFLALEFTMPNISDYRLTAALAEVFLAGDDFAGIAYPTIAKECNSDNLALLPSFVDSSLLLVEAQLILIEDILDDGAVDGQTIARLESVNAGLLKWSYTGTSSQPVPGGRAAVFRIERGQKSRLQDSGSVAINGQTYDVLPGYSIEVVDDEIGVLNLQGKRIEPTSGTRRSESFWPEAYGSDVNRYLATFGTLFAAATDVVNVRGKRAAIGFCCRIELTINEPRWNMRMVEGFGVEIHDPIVPPEQLIWARFLFRISQGHTARTPVGVVVEALPGMLDRLNAREESLIHGFYVPAGFELIYGCRGSENALAANAALGFCRSQIEELIRRIESGDLPELTEPVESAMFTRCRQFDYMMPTADGL